jgi:hexosaminidase
MLLRALLLSLGALAASAGLPWPQPASFALGGATLALDSRFFSFAASGPGASSAVLQDALARYAALLFVRAAPTAGANASTPTVGNVTSLAVAVASGDETLGLATSEAYSLTVASSGAAALTADTVYGALRGLETFSQLVDFVGSSSGSPFSFAVPTVAITDAPRFAHRGALVDTARHFVPVPTLLAFLDAMSYAKLNVFHWHIVDDQAFPYESVAFPGLSAMGAWNAPDASHVYSPRDVRNVVAYARARGIRTVVELDTPGHSQSWGLSQPGLLTQCYTNASGTPVPIAGEFGPIDPTNPSTWTFLSQLFTEVAGVFPDAYIHIGGDEVSYECWESNPQVVAWMAANNIASFEALESYYVQRVITLVDSLGKSVVGWQEIFDNNLTLPSATVVTAWKGGAAAGPEEMAKITTGGFRALLSAGWYENYIAYVRECASLKKYPH